MFTNNWVLRQCTCNDATHNTHWNCPNYQKSMDSPLWACRLPMGIIWNGYQDASYYGNLKASRPKFSSYLLFYLPLWTEVHCICHFLEVLEIFRELRRVNTDCGTDSTHASPCLFVVNASNHVFIEPQIVASIYLRGNFFFKIPR